MSTPTLPSESGDPPSSRFPMQKITAFTRLKSFGSNFIGSRSPPAVFPPPSWELDDETLGTGRSVTPTLPESNYGMPVVEPPEPVSFAQKLKSMIEELPIPVTSTAPAPSGETSKVDGEAPPSSPVPPELDPTLVHMLSSEDVMNGKSPTGTDQDAKKRDSIWNILSGLKKGNKGGSSSSRTNVVEEDEGGLMMYAPLEPESDSQVELAKSETILELADAPGEDTPGTPKPSDPDAKKMVEKHVWVPSTTELSILTTWWGYRLYLPPPIMAKLNNKTLKATARAAMLTTAIKWLLDKIPIILVPPQFRPAVKLLKRLGPLVSYIGVFIAWSWDRVRSLDEGNGVVLTATWLLPVALLPMAWDAGDIYRPVAAPTAEEMTAMQEAAAKAEEEERKAAEKAGQKGQKEKTKSLFRW